jgi:hypothetical protein
MRSRDPHWLRPKSRARSNLKGSGTGAQIRTRARSTVAHYIVNPHGARRWSLGRYSPQMGRS